MNKFDLEKAMLRDANVATRDGNKARVICKTRGKILVRVYSAISSAMDADVKYNLDGSRWSPNYKSGEDLVLLESA